MAGLGLLFLVDFHTHRQDVEQAQFMQGHTLLALKSFIF